jgi:hypothetical protein
MLTEAAPDFLEQFSRVEAAIENDPMDSRAARFLRAPRSRISGERHAKASRR